MIQMNGDIMLAVIAISLVCVAVHAATQEGMLLAWPRMVLQNLMDRLLPARLSAELQKPLFGCLTCMASVWGVAGCMTLGLPLGTWPLVVLMVCGLNTLLGREQKSAE